MFKHATRARIHGFGRAVWHHGRRALTTLDKGAHLAHDFLSHLSPDVVRAVGGEKNTQRLEKVYEGLSRYEHARGRLVGPRGAPMEVD